MTQTGSAHSSKPICTPTSLRFEIKSRHIATCPGFPRLATPSSMKSLANSGGKFASTDGLLNCDIRPEQFMTGAGEEVGFFDALANGPVSASAAEDAFGATEQRTDRQ